MSEQVLTITDYDFSVVVKATDNPRYFQSFPKLKTDIRIKTPFKILNNNNDDEVTYMAECNGIECKGCNIELDDENTLVLYNLIWTNIDRYTEYDYNKETNEFTVYLKNSKSKNDITIYQIDKVGNKKVAIIIVPDTTKKDCYVNSSHIPILTLPIKFTILPSYRYEGFTYEPDVTGINFKCLIKVEEMLAYYITEGVIPHVFRISEDPFLVDITKGDSSYEYTYKFENNYSDPISDRIDLYDSFFDNIEFISDAGYDNEGHRMSWWRRYGMPLREAYFGKYRAYQAILPFQQYSFTYHQDFLSVDYGPNKYNIICIDSFELVDEKSDSD